MRSHLALLLLAEFLTGSLAAQTAPTTNDAPSTTSSSSTQSSLDRLTQSNRDLLDLLKKQQAVLEDIQYDRRLQSRQLQLLEERLGDSLQQNALLQAKIAKLEAQAAAAPPASPVTAQSNSTNPSPDHPVIRDAPSPTPAPPASYLPPPPSPLDETSGTKSWHRLFTLSGNEAKKSDLFHIQGPTWRVVWHNQDKPGDPYKNTSALFISAFPKDDTIPQKVCSKLGSGGDSTELNGAGNYYLKVEASGGSWELAVEDFH